MTSLAIEGGVPVRRDVLPYGKQVIDEDDIQAVVNALRSDLLTTGPVVEEYENVFAETVGAKYAVALSSGTAALHAAAFAAGIKHGDEVITTPITFAATSNCVVYCNGKPVFADIQPDTCNIDPADIVKKLTPQTKAIIPVDFTGQPVDFDEIHSIAEKNRLVIIEDAAHALGAAYKERPVGSLATMTIFSTHPIKHVTTGEGGVVVTDDEKLVAKLRLFRSHGISADANQRFREKTWLYDMVHLGYNYRIPDILCALGRSQLGKLGFFLQRRRNIAARYDKSFAEMPEIEPLHILPDRESAWHLYVIRLNLKRLRVGRGEVFKALRAEGIGVNVHYIPVYWHTYYKQMGYEKGLCPIAEKQYERLITLPIWPGMMDKDEEDVIEAVTKVISAYKIR